MKRVKKSHAMRIKKMKLKISTLLSRVVKINKIPKLCEKPLARKWSENNLRLYPIFYSPNLTRSLNMAKHNQNIKLVNLDQQQQKRKNSNQFVYTSLTKEC